MQLKDVRFFVKYCTYGVHIVFKPKPNSLASYKGSDDIDDVLSIYDTCRAVRDYRGWYFDLSDINEDYWIYDCPILFGLSLGVTQCSHLNDNTKDKDSVKSFLQLYRELVIYYSNQDAINWYLSLDEETKYKYYKTVNTALYWRNALPSQIIKFYKS